MATYRIGIGSFNLKDGAVGIGTETTGLGNLKVEGTYKVTDLDVTGVSTFTRYAGFAPDNLEIGKDGRDRTLTGDHQTTGDIVVGVNSTFTVSVGATVDVGTVPSVSIGTHFSPPTGDINDRPEVPVEGTVRFNKDLNTLEFYNGVEWRQFTVSGQSGRGFVMGGGTTGGVDINQYVNITTFGNSVDFGKFAAGGRGYMGACASSTRGVVMGGWKPASRPSNSANTIEYFTMASSGDTIDFGDLQEEKGEMDCCSSSTRGLTAGGEKVPFANTDTIDYVEISTIGNSIDFGNLTVARRDGGMTASPTRAILAGGIASSTVDTIDMMTISSIGNAIDFGSLTAINYPDSSNASNTTRGYFMGGIGNDTIMTIDMFNFSSGGNAIVFGDLTTGARNAAGCSTHIRGLVMGGGNPSAHNTIQYFTLSTSGNAADFGDLSRTSNTASMASCSDSHGGLGGY